MIMFHSAHCRFAAVVAMLAIPPVLTAQSVVHDSGVVASRRGLVVSASGLASDAGASILRRGGNAVDAAVATAFARAVTYPAAGNIGGGGFMIVRPARGAPVAIDYRERAPLGATATMYLDAAGRVNGALTDSGYLAPGVPGTVHGLATAHRRFGRLPWHEVVMPAVLLAERGFVLSADLAEELNGQLSRTMGRFPASVAAYGKPGRARWQQGDTIVLRDLGRTLRAIATDGPNAFYRGWIADSIAADMRRHGGLITNRDLAAYRAKVRTPVTGRFLGYDVVSMPPPSSGGVAMIEMLNILEALHVESRPRYSARTLHLLIESARRAYLDRARHLGDPDFVRVPVARLTSKAHARALALTIDTARASSSAALGQDVLATAVRGESEHTTHFSVVDAEGNAVSNTFTLEDGYGSSVVVRGAGFLLNNEMGDFNKQPGVTTAGGQIGTPANVIVPGKRMLSSMTPTIVTKNGQLFFITGSPGGRTIINTVTQMVLNATAFRMDVRAAVDAPRLHHQWMPDETTLEQNAVPESVLAELRAMGHAVRMRGGQGDAHSIVYDAATRAAFGANDPRSADSKASVP